LPIGLADGRWQIIHGTSDNAVGIVDVNQLNVALVIGGDSAHNHIIAQTDIRSWRTSVERHIVLDTANSGYVYLFYAILKKSGLNRSDYTVKTVGANAAAPRGPAERQRQ
jgi:hypothetical protein